MYGMSGAAGSKAHNGIIMYYEIDIDMYILLHYNTSRVPLLPVVFDYTGPGGGGSEPMWSSTGLFHRVDRRRPPEVHGRWREHQEGKVF